MNLPEMAVRRPITVFMIFAGAVLLGAISLSKLPLSLLPDTSYPAISIITYYAGVSPQKIESLITKPIEEAIGTVGGVVNIYSVSEEGKSRVNVEFEVGMDMDFAALEVREKVGLVRSGFPRDVEEPLVIRFDPSDRSIMILTLSSEALDLKELRDLADNVVKRRVERVEGVAEVQVGGGLQREIVVEVKRDDLASRGLSLLDVVREVQFGNLALPAGKVHEGGLEHLAGTAGRYTDIREIADTALQSTPEGSLVRVRDVGTVRDHHKDPDSLARFNLKERVSIYIQRAGDANIIEVSKGISKEISKLRLSGAELSVAYDQAEFIEEAIRRVRDAGVMGAILTIAVLLAFLRSLKSTFIIALAIPVSVMATFTVMYIQGLSLNVMTLSGLALGIGMLVDNGIVVLESISRHGRFKPPGDAAAEGAGEVAKAIFASTLTTVAVFLPVAFVEKEAQILYAGLAFTVTYSLTASLIVSLTLIPALSGKLNPFGFLSAPEPATRSRIARIYRRVLIGALRKRYWVLATAVGLVLASAFAIPRLPREYLDVLDAGEILAYVELPTGTNLEATDRTVREVERRIAELPEIERISTKVERWHATLVIELVDRGKRRKGPAEIIADLKARLRGIEGAFVHFAEGGQATGGREVDIEITGNDNDRLRELAKVAARAVEGTPGITDVVLRFREGRPEIRIDVERDKVALAGLTVKDVGYLVRGGIYGPIATKFLDEGREVDVRVRYRKEDRDDLGDLEAMLLPGPQGSAVPLSQIARLTETTGPTKIWRKNQRRMVAITARLGRVDLGTAISRIAQRLRGIEMPEDYAISLGQTYQKLKENQEQMVLALALTLVLIYIILASLFESLTYPLVIITSIPLAGMGAVWALLATGSSLNLAVYIGLIMLAGIVVNNAIILVDYTNALRRRGLGLLRAILTAGEVRLRPVTMTAMTTILGLMPLALKSGEGSNLWQPLAITVMGGLTVSTVLTLVVVPAFYLIINGRNRKSFGRRESSSWSTR
ncbi:MAG: efflux RND transporter permease subunit [bacterium]